MPAKVHITDLHGMAGGKWGRGLGWGVQGGWGGGLVFTHFTLMYCATYITTMYVCTAHGNKKKITFL